MSSTKSAVNASTSTSDNHSTDPEKLITESSLEGEAEEPEKYLNGISLGLVVLGLGLMTFLVGLDNSILATAIPTITTKFNSLDDVGWYGSAFLICV